jgi:predicted secreted hydrolase
VQLDNGVVFMFGEFHNGLGGERRVYAGTLSYPDGRQLKLEQDDFKLAALDQWTSPTSSVTYPAGWHVRFPGENIELEIEPVIPDQEMSVSFVYYEGAARVRAMMDGAEVLGRGYVELTGYSDRTGGHQR